ncbi:MAG TPA: substrate-binding domain-containing protein [Chthoniobacterales bacterium]
MSAKAFRHSKAATIKDVAARAGVSYQTVSRVVNVDPHVKNETRARVTEAMVELHYRPNVAARHLASRRSRTIGFIGSLLYYGPVRVMLGVEQTAKKHGYNVMIVELAKVNAEEIRSAVEELCARQVDGIVILVSLDLDLEFIRTERGEIPLIAVDVDLGSDLPAVLVDQEKGSFLAIRHVTGLGHRRIAFICGPMGWRASRLRKEGWMKALKSAGLSPGPIYEGDWTPRSGYEATQRLICEHRGEFSAVVVANDHMALGVLSAFSENGIKVPDEVSVLGFDGLPETAFYHPPLSTIYQDFGALGEVALEYLLEVINRPNAKPNRYILKPELVSRKSTKALSSKS